MDYSDVSGVTQGILWLLSAYLFGGLLTLQEHLRIAHSSLLLSSIPLCGNATAYPFLDGCFGSEDSDVTKVTVL